MQRLLLKFNLANNINDNPTIPNYYNPLLYSFFMNHLDKDIKKQYKNNILPIFNFSKIKNFLYNSEDKQKYKLPKSFSIIFSSIYKDIIENFIDNTFLKYKLQFFNNINIYIKKIQYLKPYKIDTSKITLNTISPILVYKEFEYKNNKKIKYFFYPKEKEFLNLLKEDIYNKYISFFKRQPPYELKIKIENYREKKIILNNNLIYSYWLTAKIKSLDRDLINLILHTGLGYDNELGFGMVKLIKERRKNA